MVQYAVRGAALSSDVIDSILDSDKGTEPLNYTIA